MTADVLPLNGCRQSGHFIKDRAEAEQIRACIQFLATCLSGGQISHRAHRHSGAGERIINGPHSSRDSLAAASNESISCRRTSSPAHASSSKATRWPPSRSRAE